MTTSVSILNHAFKEWACVVEALATGRQILILRKGGIHEKGKKFNVLHESFFLFPTYEHQNEEDLNDDGKNLLKKVTAEHVQAKPDTLRIQYFAEAKESLWVEDFGVLLKIQPFHIWSETAIKKRFEWSDHKGLYVIAVRVYRLPQANLSSLLPSYGGCKSWVDLASPIDPAGLQAVLPEDKFNSYLLRVKKALSS